MVNDHSLSYNQFHDAVIKSGISSDAIGREEKNDGQEEFEVEEYVPSNRGWSLSFR